jgi:hypothetical protein
MYYRTLQTRHVAVGRLTYDLHLDYPAQCIFGVLDQIDLSNSVTEQRCRAYITDRYQLPAVQNCAAPSRALHASAVARATTV